jgi:hypothetical protein
VIEGTGYFTGLNLDVRVTTAGNAAATAYVEDAPYSFLDSIVLSDPSGELVNVTGYDLYLHNVFGGWHSPGGLLRVATSTEVYQLVSGAGATGGSFRFHLRVPTAIRTRDFLAAVGNQDRAVKYQIRDDVAVGTAVYSTPPTTPGTFIINRTYESITVPQAANAMGVAQQTVPPKRGVLSFLTRQRSPSDPVGGSIVNHYLPRIGNTIRYWILVFRSNNSRATAEANMPTRIQLLLGDVPIFTEDTAYRRKVMYDRYGFDVIAAQAQGVLVYDFEQDVLPFAGGEAGLDWLWSAGLVNAQFQITYPTGFGAAANSLIVNTADMIVPDDVDVYAAD